MAVWALVGTGERDGDREHPGDPHAPAAVHFLEPCGPEACAMRAALGICNFTSYF